MKKWFAVFLAALSMLIVRMRYECRHFKTEYYEIYDKMIPEAFEGFRFIMLSDLHNYDFGQDNAALLQAIDAQRPDCIMIAGDMIDAQPGADMDTAIRFVQALCKKYTVYFGNGNHEQRIALYPEQYGNMAERWQTMSSHPNLIRLDNVQTFITRKNAKIKVAGLSLNRIYYKRFHLTPMADDYMRATLGEKTDLYTILIAHNPFYLKEYAKWGANLVLSGHVHGGVIRLPFVGGLLSPQVQFFPEYDAGHFKEDTCQMILSRGLHMHSIRIRLLNMPEVSCVTLHHANKNSKRN